MSISDIHRPTLRRLATSLVESLTHQDLAVYYLIENAWDSETEDPFLLSLAQALCLELIHAVKCGYKNRGAAWKRTVERNLKEFSVSLGMRITASRMKRGRYND